MSQNWTLEYHYNGSGTTRETQQARAGTYLNSQALSYPEVLEMYKKNEHPEAKSQIEKFLTKVDELFTKYDGLTSLSA